MFLLNFFFLVSMDILESVTSTGTLLIVNATDPEGDTVNYAMTSYPVSTFAIDSISENSKIV